MYVAQENVHITGPHIQKGNKLSFYKFKVGDRVCFIDPTLNTGHNGVIEAYLEGRDKKAKAYNLNPKDYLVKFDKPLWNNGPDKAWCAANDLSPWNTNVKSRYKNNTVTYTSSSTTTNQLNNYNIQIKKDNKLAESTISTEERPWTHYYVTADEFFEVLRIAFDDTYGGGSDTPWHPEDMYINVVSTLEIVANTLSNMAKIKSGRPLKGIKEI